MSYELSTHWALHYFSNLEIQPDTTILICVHLFSPVLAYHSKAKNTALQRYNFIRRKVVI